MFDKDFLGYLEYQLTNAFNKSKNIEVKGFWCDGILPTYENEKVIFEKKEILLTAFLGKDGQGKYDLTLKFGTNSLKNLAKGLDLSECIPNSEIKDWFDIDISKNKIIVQLL